MKPKTTREAMSSTAYVMSSCSVAGVADRGAGVMGHACHQRKSPQQQQHRATQRATHLVLVLHLAALGGAPVDGVADGEDDAEDRQDVEGRLRRGGEAGGAVGPRREDEGDDGERKDDCRYGGDGLRVEGAPRWRTDT